MPKDYSEQRSMIEKVVTELTTYWRQRDEQFLLDRDIINLIKPEKKTGEVKWTSNEPKVFFDTSRALVSLNPPRFKLPMTINYSPEDKEKMNKAERLCIGIFRTLDARVQERGGANWLWDLAYWVLLGWWSVFSIVRRNEETKELEFIADLWDPMTVYPKWDTDGLLECVRTYEVNRLTAIAMAEDYLKQGLEFDFYEPPDDGSKPKVVNYWRRTGVGKQAKIENAIMISGQVVKSLTVHKKLVRIPIHVGAIGSPDMVIPQWELRKGESVIAANRDMYDYENIMISLMAVIMSSQAYPNILEKTRTGQPAHKGEEFQGYGTKLTYKLEDAVELLKNATSPEETNILLQFVANQKHKGSVPPAVYGNIPVELSGFAISQLLAAVKYKLGPYLNAMQSIISRIATDHLYQFRTGKFGKITLSTENPYDIKRGMTYIEEFSHQDVPDNIYVDVTIPITSQFDKTQAILNAVQALNSGLLSRETLWELDLDIQDTTQERERIHQDMVDRDPFILAIEIIEGMREREVLYRAQGNIAAAEAVHRYIMLKEMEIGMRQGIPQTARQPGIPPSQSPPEARESPDQLRAATGTPPPSPTRAKREESAGRQGILLSPSGEVLL